MAKSVLMVLTNPVAGKEDEFNDWYTNVHIREIVEVPGIVSAQRFKLAEAQSGPVGSHEYLAIYEVEGDPAVAVAALKAAGPGLQTSDALDRSTASGQMFTAISDRVTA